RAAAEALRTLGIRNAAAPHRRRGVSLLAGARGRLTDRFKKEVRLSSLTQLVRLESLTSLLLKWFLTLPLDESTTQQGVLRKRQLEDTPCVFSVCRAQFSQHVAEQGTLLDGIVERLVSVRQGIEPPPRHVALGRFAIIRPEQGHRQRLDVEGRVRE